MKKTSKKLAKPTTPISRYRGTAILGRVFSDMSVNGVFDMTDEEVHYIAQIVHNSIIANFNPENLPTAVNHGNKKRGY